MDAAFRTPEALDRRRMRGQEGVGQRIEAAVPLPAGVRHEESTAEPEGRHVVGDRLLCVRHDTPDRRSNPFEESLLVRRERGEIGVDPGVTC